MSILSDFPRPLGIVAKFSVAVALLGVLFGVLAKYSAIQLDRAREVISEIIDYEYPRSEAAFEMEINTLGTGLAVVKYLRKPDQAHRDRITKDSQDFASFLAINLGLARTERERALLQQIKARYTEQYDLGLEIMAARDAELAGVRSIMEPLRALENSMENEIALRHDLAGETEGSLVALHQLLESGVDGMTGMLTALPPTSWTQVNLDIGLLRSRLDDALSAFVETSGNADHRALAERVKAELDKIDKIAVGVQANVRIVDENFDRIVVLRDELDRLLDDHFQALVAADMTQAHGEAERTMSEVRSVVTNGSRGLAFAFLLAILWISRTFVAPLRRFADTAKAFGQGDLNRRLPVQGRDEFATLASAFNGMAEKVQETLHELGQVNATLTQTVTELEHARERLETRVSERTQALTEAFMEQLATEEKLRLRMAELAHVHRVNTTSEMAVTMIHEITQPLTAIAGYASGAVQLLERPDSPTDKLRDALAHIQAQGDRARDVLQSLRQRMQRARPKADRIDLESIVMSAVDLLRLETDRHQIEVSIRVDPDLPTVRGDAIQVEQVLTNLMLNATQAMRESASAERRLGISLRRADSGNIEIAVSDTGTGLKDSELVAVFEPFYSTKNDGMGMGLSISRSIVEVMGGRIWAAANEPRGSIFFIRLPAV
jgi:signal transduction histidine kinase